MRDLYIHKFEDMLIYYAECCLGLGENEVRNSSFRKAIFFTLAPFLIYHFEDKDIVHRAKRPGSARLRILNLTPKNPKYNVFVFLGLRFLDAYPDLKKAWFI